MGLYQKAASGSGQDQLFASPNGKLVHQWSRDGRFIVYSEYDPATLHDLWVLPVNESGEPSGKPILFLRTGFREYDGQISPDGHWMAYTSEESGKPEVYVRPFPASDGQWRISTSGGEQPRWRGDGKELFFPAPDGKMTAVPVKAVSGAKPSLDVGVPAALFDSHIEPRGPVDLTWRYDVTADGKRFLVNTTTAAVSHPPLTVVVDWQAGLKK